MFNSIINKCNIFYRIATLNISDVKIDSDGMRPESFDLVKKQRGSKGKMRPIEISIYPNEPPVLIDGRHRLSVAKELGDSKIEALIRYYDSDANIVKKELITLPLT